MNKRSTVIALGLLIGLSVEAKPVTGFEGTRDISDARVAEQRAAIQEFLSTGKWVERVQRECGFSLPAEVDDDAIRIGAYFDGNDTLTWLNSIYKDLAFMCGRMTGHEAYKKGIAAKVKKLVIRGSVTRNLKAEVPSMALSGGVLTLGVGTVPNENVVLRTFADDGDALRTFLKGAL